MKQGAVDLSVEERGVLFSADEEALSHGWATEDPYPKILKLMEGPSVQRGSLHELMGLPAQFGSIFADRDAYTVLSYDAVNTAFMDGDTFTNKVYETLSKPALGDTLLNLDGADHRRMRNIAKPYFKPSFAESWWNDKWIVHAVAELFDRITRKDWAELNLELCAPLPMSVISHGFGIARSEALDFRKALHDVMAHETPEKVKAAAELIHGVLLKIMSARRANPQDDLISKMVHADLEVEGGATRKLTDDEVMRYCQLIVHAGGGTTWRQLGITIMALLNNPEQMQALRQDRKLLRPAIQKIDALVSHRPCVLALGRQGHRARRSGNKGRVDHVSVRCGRQPRSLTMDQSRRLRPASPCEASFRVWRRDTCVLGSASFPARDGGGAERPSRPAAEFALGRVQTCGAPFGGHACRPRGQRPQRQI